MRGRVKLRTVKKFVPSGWSVKVKDGRLVLEHKDYGEFAGVDILKLIDKKVISLPPQYEAILKGVVKGDVEVSENGEQNPYVTAALIGLGALGITGLVFYTIRRRKK